MKTGGAEALVELLERIQTGTPPDPPGKQSCCLSCHLTASIPPSLPPFLPELLYIFEN